MVLDPQQPDWLWCPESPRSRAVRIRSAPSARAVAPPYTPATRSQRQRPVLLPGFVQGAEPPLPRIPSQQPGPAPLAGPELLRRQESGVRCATPSWFAWKPEFTYLLEYQRTFHGRDEVSRRISALCESCQVEVSSPASAWETLRWNCTR